MDLEILLKRLARKKGVWQNTDLTDLDIEVEKLKHTRPNEERFADAVVRHIAVFTQDDPPPSEQSLAG